MYCYSSARPLLTNAYWTIDGGNSYIYNDNAQISFMSTLRQADFSSNWTMLMTNIISTVTTTTTTLLSTASTLIFDKTGSSSFSMSYTGAMQKGVVFLEL